MPFGIFIIMKRKYPSFTTADEMNTLIDQYFTYIKGKYKLEQKSIKDTKANTEKPRQKVWVREPEPAIITGLALFLGFDSLQAFDDYENTGKFAAILKSGRLRIEAGYEKKLHHQSSAGAIFALKNLGWNEKAEGKTPGRSLSKILKIKIIETGPKPAANEKEVALDS
jgi:hypothetical protein